MAHTKHANSVANEHRKKAASLPFRLAGYVTGSTNANWTKSMTPVELHAELVYAESLFEKVCLLGHKHVTRADLIGLRSGPVGDCLFRRLARIHQRSVRTTPFRLVFFHFFNFY